MSSAPVLGTTHIAAALSFLRPLELFHTHKQKLIISNAGQAVIFKTAPPPSSQRLTLLLLANYHPQTPLPLSPTLTLININIPPHHTHKN
ncbi:hypothetical protein CVT25_015910 [Psilocybe cyanescens]|uniref:Uncharacterized protein n=1 Tax=Psilocybe cyanescens TaxID=93625 RepID=A0A409WSD7_PSICY|nr:hypothetical protein CVT25_015910 [Psilocybe cyanescens]